MESRRRRNRTPQRARWWPAVLIVLISAALLIGKDLLIQDSSQTRFVFSATIILISILLLLLWLLLFSRLPVRVRLSSLMALVALGLLCALLFRIQGFTGDLVPVVEFRWSTSPAPYLAERVDTSSSDFAESNETSRDKPSTATRTPDSARPIDSQLDYPQYLGPDRDAFLREIRLRTDWDVHPPELRWSRPVAAGWSAFAVSGGLAVTQEQMGDQETVVAYDLSNGREVWRHHYIARYESNLAGLGPRATPTINGGLVFSMGATGILNCLDLRDGRLVWTRNVIQENDSKNPPWGNSCSPLVVDNRVVVSAGGNNGRALVAYDCETGRPIWSGGDDSLGYSSPQIRVLAGVRQILIFNSSSVASHDPENGRVFWEFPWSNAQPNVSQPLCLADDKVLISSGYGIGSKLIHVTREAGGSFKVTQLWETPRLKAKFTNLVTLDGFVYGLDDGILMCLDPSSGKPEWKKGRYGHGQIILVGDVILLQSERGEIVLIDPNPDELVELTGFQALEGKTWNPPALSGNLLLVRNDRQAACYQLPVESGIVAP